LQEMVEEKIPITLNTFNAQLNCFATAAKNWKKHRVQICNDAEAVFLDLKNRFAPTLTTLNVVLKLYCESINLQLATATFDSISQQYGLTPDAYSYAAMVRLYTKANEPQKALEWLRLMQKANYQPQKATLLSVINCLAGKSFVQDAIELVRAMRENGLTVKRSEAKSLWRMAVLHGVQRDVEVLLLSDVPVKNYKVYRQPQRSRYYQAEKEIRKEVPRGSPVPTTKPEVAARKQRPIHSDLLI